MRAALLTVDQEAGLEEAPVCIGRFPCPVESGAFLGACAPSHRLKSREVWELGPVDSTRVTFPHGGARVCADQMIMQGHLLENICGHVSVYQKAPRQC